MTAGRGRVEILDGPEELAARAADEVVDRLTRALSRRPSASWVLAGGSTPRRLYRLLAERPAALDWRRVELYWGDERCVPPESAESNYRMVRETLPAGLPLEPGRLHPIEGALPSQPAAARYQERVRSALAEAPFDLVLLGLGTDGHVA